ncbi:CU044_5270 family protein [Actinoallomurus sp. NPDC052308]|uniref:CU044_5270 family protein n=1 Tax=Actinoallomurus sp. NPDC052308 TaxID=3155530 RepID=UPI00341C576C
MDDLHQIRDRHDALSDPAPETIAQVRARLTAHMRETPARKPLRKPAWRRAGGLGLGLAAAATSAVLLTALAGGGGSGEDRKLGQPSVRLRPVANAQDLASNAAVLAAAEKEAMPKPHQWAYTKTLAVEYKDGGGYLRGAAPKVGKPVESWHRVDDWGYADYRNGMLTVHKGFEGQVPYQEILALPQNPDELLAHVYKTVTKGGTAEPGLQRPKGAKPVPMGDEERNQYAFMYITGAMWDSVVPAKLRAALYGALAKIPDVGYEARATDLAKRPGVTLYHEQGGYLRSEIFIDPKTYEYLGEREIAVKDHKQMGENLKKGDIVSWSSKLKATIVDQPGRRS